VIITVLITVSTTIIIFGQLDPYIPISNTMEPMTAQLKLAESRCLRFVHARLVVWLLRHSWFPKQRQSPLHAFHSLKLVSGLVRFPLDVNAQVSSGTLTVVSHDWLGSSIRLSLFITRLATGRAS
jgi:hypothetical protein